MDEAAAELQVTPEEERFLKRFFRRQLAPWLVLLLGVSLAAGWWGRGGDDEAAREARTAAAMAQLRNENQRLLEQIAALREQVEAGAQASPGDELERRVEAARRNVRMIESRVTAALEQRIAALEAQQTREEVAPPPDLAAWDVSAILDRLYALETRQQEGGVGAGVSPAAVSRLEDRLAALEQRLPALPAAPAP